MSNKTNTEQCHLWLSWVVCSPQLVYGGFYVLQSPFNELSGLLICILRQPYILLLVIEHNVSYFLLQSLSHSPSHLHYNRLQFLNITVLIQPHKLMPSLKWITKILKNSLTIMKIYLSLCNLQWLIVLHKMSTIRCNNSLE